MDPDFWRSRWAKNEIGFHQAGATPALVRHLAALGPAPQRVLVPLSGKTKDLRFLAEAGHHPIGVELVEDAVRAYYDEEKIVPTRTEARTYVRYDGGGVTTYAADFFALDWAAVGPIDRVFDRAAMVALPKGLRTRYTQQLLSLLQPGAHSLIVTFDHDLPNEGPPFSISVDELTRTYQAYGQLTVLETVDAFEDNPRFRERGATRLSESLVLFTRGTQQK